LARIDECLARIGTSSVGPGPRRTSDLGVTLALAGRRSLVQSRLPRTNWEEHSDIFSSSRCAASKPRPLLSGSLLSASSELSRVDGVTVGVSDFRGDGGTAICSGATRLPAATFDRLSASALKGVSTSDTRTGGAGMHDGADEC
jgi:hypothetical protein